MTAGTPLQNLQQRLGVDWPHLRAARDRALATKSLLLDALTQFDSSDYVVVASGSLARNEFTQGSDIDWTLLIDCPADPRHYEITTKVKKVIDDVAAKPTGIEGTFSGMVF